MEAPLRSIVFLDLDGTFWDELDVVPASTMEAIRLAQANGHVVFSNTGRSRGGTRDLTGYGLNGRSYAAGSEVFVGDKKIQDRPLTLEESLALRNSLDFGIGILIAEGGDRCFLHAYDQELFDEQHARLSSVGDPFLDHADLSEMTEADHVQTYKYSVFVRGGVPDEIKAACPAGFGPTTMGDATEFTRTGTSKATSLSIVANYYLELDGEMTRTIAVGDSANNLPMLRAADVSVCMGNGTDAVKAEAEFVTRSIHDDGVFHAFEHFGVI
jgi:hydroxymethylpyrimidine pyrophosphatase-like HAD family hydrolase